MYDKLIDRAECTLTFLSNVFCKVKKNTKKCFTIEGYGAFQINTFNFFYRIRFKSFIKTVKYINVFQLPRNSKIDNRSSSAIEKPCLSQVSCKPFPISCNKPSIEMQVFIKVQSLTKTLLCCSHNTKMILFHKNCLTFHLLH